jgi:hypothetical protein
MTRTKLSAAAFAAVAILALVPMVVAAQTNVAGPWEITMVTPQGPNTVDVRFEQSGSAVTGDLTSPLGVASFKGTLAGDALTVVASLDVQGTALELTFNAKVTGDTLAGTVKLGDLGEAPFTGKRKAVDAAPASARAAAPAAPAAATTAPAGSVSGNWNITINVQGQEIPLAATFTQDGGKLTGSFTSDQGTMAVAGTMTGNALKLEFIAPTPNGDLPVVMTGDLAAGALSGKMNIAGLGDADWVGQRAK